MRAVPAVLAALALAAVLVLWYSAPGAAETASVSTPEGPVTLAVADTPGERRTGLMNRTQVPFDGMLFIYPDAQPRTFWMKDTRIPLDIVFVAGNGSVLNVEQAAPEPGTPPQELTRYRSDGEARYVIELPQGRAAELGLAPGERVSIHGR